MRNITLALDDELLRESREYARRHHTTLNELVRRQLRESVRRSSTLWVEELFRNMDSARANSGGRRWKREDLYDA